MSDPKQPGASAPLPKTSVADGGELHQRDAATPLTTNQGVVIADNQNSVKSGARGPTLLEDFILREKITHFDHERIPERIVHARGSAAHGWFQPYQSWSDLTCASFLADPNKKTPVFTRISTVAGGAGSVDTPRDVRGFAVKFYTDAGNFDLVGNNIPVFFIQDAIKFPDLIHSVKMEPDRGFPQSATAHDTFWDFMSLMPEAMHMVMWIMSDRTIPRSLRMVDGFGIHTFRLVNADGRAKLVKFHWRAKDGCLSTTWDEAVKIAGADQDYHRRDLWNAIERGDYPEWELSAQIFDDDLADSLPYDVLDATKLIPEEVVPLTPLGRMVLDRNPDNFFAETEQAAFHPGHVVPGIDFTNDPLLQGRLHSYLDTQLKRLGGPNFHEIEINRPKCPWHNLQRDGHMRMRVARGRVAYEPNSLDPDGPRERPDAGFRSFPAPEAGEKRRVRADTFADHYSQARLFFRSQNEVEQQHIIDALVFELGMVDTVAIRTRMLGHLVHIDDTLADAVAEGLGLARADADAITPAKAPFDMDESPALSLHGRVRKTLRGRVIAVLVTDGVDPGLVDALRSAAADEGATLEIVAEKRGGVTDASGGRIPADHALAAAPSALFDAVAVVATKDGAEALADMPPAVQWLMDALNHLKVIGNAGADALLAKAGVPRQGDGVVTIGGAGDAKGFVTTARDEQRVFRRPH